MYVYTCIHLGTQACEQLYDIICNNGLLVDVQKIPPQQLADQQLRKLP